MGPLAVVMVKVLFYFNISGFFFSFFFHFCSSLLQLEVPCPSQASEHIGNSAHTPYCLLYLYSAIQHQISMTANTENTLDELAVDVIQHQPVMYYYRGRALSMHL